MNGILTSGSNNNNGWLGGSDAAAEVKRYYCITLSCIIAQIRALGLGLTVPLSPGLTGGQVNVGYLLVGISSCCDTGGGGQPAGGDVQNCLQMRWKDAMWDDVSCNGAKEYFVCKK